MEQLLFLIFNVVIEILTAERRTGTQQMIYIDRLQNNFITTILFLSPRIKWKLHWYIIKTETCKNHTNKGTELISKDGNLITNQQSIANSFNNHFL